MEYKFSEIVDISILHKLFERLYLATGIPSGIVDLDNNILVEVGWRDICTKFHRNNIETERLCKQSDQYLNDQMQKDGGITKPYIIYTCQNGLIEAAAPIIIQGKYLAIIMQGQFLFEEPDIEKFRNQARKYGFDEEEYLKALAAVPIYSKSKLDSIMQLYIQIAELLANMGIDRLQLIESQNRALRESEERIKTIINNTPNVAVQSFDVNGKILFTNKASESIFGWIAEDAVGKTIDQLFLNQAKNEEFLDFIRNIDKLSKPYEATERTYVNMQGIEKTVLSTIFPIHLFEEKLEFISMDIDITEKKLLEKEMQRLDQLNIIGQMAAGIGHEIRNPMTTIRGYLQMLQDKQPLQAYKDRFELMISEIDRANSIITEFLSLAKTKPSKTTMSNLNDIIIKIFSLLQADAFSMNMDITYELGEIPLIPLNSNEMVQLILNLCRNGLEAMKPGGHLTLKTFQEGEIVVLSVKDEGSGISQENISMIGKPFFSTKDNGTGLGLACCYNIVTRHNGMIDIDSGPGGTTFFVRFHCRDTFS